MNNDEVYVVIPTIDDFASSIKSERTIVDEKIEKLLTVSYEIEKYYDTPTGNLMRESLIEYLNSCKSDCEDLSDLANRLEKVSEMYRIALDTINKKVGDQ